MLIIQKYGLQNTLTSFRRPPPSIYVNSGTAPSFRYTNPSLQSILYVFNSNYVVNGLFDLLGCTYPSMINKLRRSNKNNPSLHLVNNKPQLSICRVILARYL